MKLKYWVVVTLSFWAFLDYCLVAAWIYMLRIMEIGG